jgi:hypothetical protein
MTALHCRIEPVTATVTAAVAVTDADVAVTDAAVAVVVIDRRMKAVEV